MIIVRLISTVFILCVSFGAVAEYKYKLVERDKHRIHVVIIDPEEYEISLVPAHNQVFGRERVGNIADRENAQIAINAGFFQIGDIEDGRPTGTLVSDGQVFGMRTTKHGCLVKRGNKLNVEMLVPSLEIILGDHKIKPVRFNKFASGRNVFYFNRAWGPKTLSNYLNRQEIVFDSNLKVLEIAAHGNNEIPENGYVLSFPKTKDLSNVKPGQQASFNWTPGYFSERGNFAVMGIPPLILNKKINTKLSKSQQHARTAVGIKEDGKLVLVVIEHVYKKLVSDVTIHEIKEIMEKKHLSFSSLNVSEVKKIILDELSSSSTAIGVTSFELAKFMQEIGCIAAINLDGGGSSTLYIDGKYINETIGDSDEGAGRKVIRPVSDAIVFKKLSFLDTKSK